MWFIENKRSSNRLNVEFSSQEKAITHLGNMGSVLSEEYRLVHDSGNIFVDKILTEGLEQGDLEKILLPRMSIDEYVPANAQTDNIVIAFFIKGVPEAVIPFKNFCEHCNGVLDVDYGDSDTIMNTSVVYVELDRENLDIKDVDDLVEQVSMIATLKKDDFTMTFPHTNKKFPYNLGLLQRYFTSRNRRKNLIAQKKAEKVAQAKLNKQLRSEPTQESMVDNLVKKFLEG